MCYFIVDFSFFVNLVIKKLSSMSDSDSMGLESSESDSDSMELESSKYESYHIFLETPPLLVDSCLETIAKNFRRYNLAFITIKDEIMNRMLEFLQRKYSYDMIKRLKKSSNYLPEKYVDLLINKYLRSLETTWLRKYSWEKVNNKMAEIGNNIEEIILRHEHSGKPCEERPWQKVLCYFPNLRSITFDGLGDCCSGLILKSVANFCPNIEEIDFKNSCITLEVAKNFCKNENGKYFCEKLKKLCMSTYGRLGALAYFIANFKTLETIEKPDLPFALYLMHKSDISSLDKIEPYNIHKLNLIPYAHDSFLADLLKVCLSVCPHLKSVSCGLVDELDFPPNLPELEQLKIINYNEYSKINIDNILKPKKESLTSLKIVNCAVSICLLAESCPRVKELILKNVNLLFDDNSKPLFNSLSSCTFESINVSMNSKAVSLILSSSSFKLESLAFRSCNVLSSEVEKLILQCCMSCSVQKISFWCTEIREKFLKDVLLNCTSLTNLNISHYFVRDYDDELLKLAEILPNKPKISDHDDLGFDHDEFYHHDKYSYSYYFPWDAEFRLDSD